jgi:cytoskeletal protein CcmA (bactofilin family)
LVRGAVIAKKGLRAHSNISIDGDIDVNFISIHGDLRAKGAVISTQYVYVTGDIVIGGSISASSLTAQNINVGGNIDTKYCLVSKQEIKSSGSIAAGTYIEANGNIASGAYLYAAEHITGMSINAKKEIRAGSLIKAGQDILSGYISSKGSIKAERTISSNSSIHAKDDIDAQNIISGTSITAGGSIIVNNSIVSGQSNILASLPNIISANTFSEKIGGDIHAGADLKAGNQIIAWSGTIEVGHCIEVGNCLIAGASVSAKRVSVGFRIFVGLTESHNEPSHEQISPKGRLSAVLESGELAYGRYSSPLDTD